MNLSHTRRMTFLLFSLTATTLAETLAPDPSWERASPGWEATFPADEFPHPDFQTEWWYFTGNLETKDGRRFGYQLTFFRRGLRPPAGRRPVSSKWIADHLWFAHFAITDVEDEEFHHASQSARGAFDDAPPSDWSARLAAPASARSRLVWVRDWSLDTPPESRIGSYLLKASHGEGKERFAIDLALDTDFAPVFHGENGFSPKAPGAEHASHYYSLTRLRTRGIVQVGETEFEVEGLSWYDREWSTSLLATNQVGWDWFSLQFRDGSDLMLFQLRDSEGNPNFVSGTLVRPDRSVLRLDEEDVLLEWNRDWRPPGARASYPVRWLVEIPALRSTRLTVEPVMRDQRLDIAGLAYWEGAVTAFGFLDGDAALARGYLEMTGYEGPLPGLSTP